MGPTPDFQSDQFLQAWVTVRTVILYKIVGVQAELTVKAILNAEKTERAIKDEVRQQIEDIYAEELAYRSTFTPGAPLPPQPQNLPPGDPP